jgi:hypothetical protein
VTIKFWERLSTSCNLHNSYIVTNAMKQSFLRY